MNIMKLTQIIIILIVLCGCNQKAQKKLMMMLKMKMKQKTKIKSCVGLKNRVRNRLKMKSGYYYRSYCAEQQYPLVLKLKCEEDCRDPKIMWIEFASFGQIAGSCPKYIPTYCSIDCINQLNTFCKEKVQCKTKVDRGKLGTPICGYRQDVRVTFTCRCSLDTSGAEKRKTLESNGDKNFLEQSERMYSEDEKYYAMLDKDCNFQVFDLEGESKWALGSKKDKGNPPFTLELEEEGDLTIKDNAENSIWSTGTTDTGKSPYKLTLTSEGKLILKDSDDEEKWKSK